MKMTGIIFSNIYDGTLGELTLHRTLASLPFGGRYRQIDFVLSNMVNSNISTVGVITKYNYQSLMDHLGSCAEWDLSRKNGGLFILPPFSEGQSTIYRGKIEALHGAATFLEKTPADYILMSDSNVLCNIDYREVLASHIKSGADITIVANRSKEYDPSRKYHLVLKVHRGKVFDVVLDTQADEGNHIGMGMFLMERSFLLKLIYSSVAHGYYHFERDFLQAQFLRGALNLNVYTFDGVVLRNDDIPSYLENNLALLKPAVRRDLFDPAAPIYTKVRDEVPTQYGKHASVRDCMIADGCRIEGTVENSVIFRDVTVERGAVIRNSIIMQGSYISANSDISYSILDKDVQVSSYKTLHGAAQAPLIIGKEVKV